MNRSKFGDLMDSVYDDLKRLNRTKGHDYAGDDDALANFKLAGQRLGLTPEAVWGVYASKHWSAIETYIKEGQVESEPIEGRIKDAILYLFLLMGLVAESYDASSLELQHLGVDPVDNGNPPVVADEPSPGALADAYLED